MKIFVAGKSDILDLIIDDERISSFLCEDNSLYLIEKAKRHHKAFYWDLRYLYSEHEIMDLREGIAGFKGDGIFYTDLGIYQLLRELHREELGIYDGYTLLSNGSDASFYASLGQSAVLARELTKEEYLEISSINKNLMIQIGGHTLVSTSKRNYLRSYFEHNHKDYEEGIYYIQERSRDFKQRIIEDSHGTHIYSALPYVPLKDLKQLKASFAYGLVETNLLTKGEISELLEFIAEKRANVSFDSDEGYLYRKTNLLK